MRWQSWEVQLVVGCYQLVFSHCHCHCHFHCRRCVEHHYQQLLWSERSNCISILPSLYAVPNSTHIYGVMRIQKCRGYKLQEGACVLTSYMPVCSPLVVPCTLYIASESNHLLGSPHLSFHRLIDSIPHGEKGHAVSATLIPTDIPVTHASSTIYIASSTHTHTHTYTHTQVSPSPSRSYSYFYCAVVEQLLGIRHCLP